MIMMCCMGIMHPIVGQTTAKQPSAYRGYFHLDGKISLDSLTRYVHRLSGMRFSFNSSKVKGSKEIPFPKGDYSFTQLLEQIRKTTSLYYSFYQGYVIFQDNPPKQSVAPDATTKQRTVTAPPSRASPSATARQKQPTAAVPAAQTGKVMAVNKPERTAGEVYDTAAIAVSIPPGNFGIAVRKDSAVRKPASAPPISNEKPDQVQRLHMGLQWSPLLPVQGTGYYFKGMDGRSAPWQYLLPGFWLAYDHQGKGAWMIQLSPFSIHQAGQNVLATQRITQPPPDSFTVREVTQLVKTKAFTTGIQYNYYISKHWFLGAGMQFHIQQKALLRKTLQKEADGTLRSDSLIGIGRSEAAWTYLANSFFTAKLELGYRSGKIESGVFLQLPVSSMASGTSLRPLNGMAFLRWAIR